MGILDFGSFFELMMIECLLSDFILFDIYFYLKLEMMENKHLHFPDQARPDWRTIKTSLMKQLGTSSQVPQVGRIRD